jgi:hypothetical protein
MVLFEIDPQRPPLVPLEGDAPRAVHMDRVAPWPSAAQRVEIEAGLIERFQPCRFVDGIQTDGNCESVCLKGWGEVPSRSRHDRVAAVKILQRIPTRATVSRRSG